MKINKIITGASLFLFSAIALAGDLDMRILNLQSTAQVEIEPDTLHVRLQGVSEKKEGSEIDISAEVNEAVSKFLKIVKAEGDIEVSVSNHRSFMITDRVKDEGEGEFVNRWVTKVDISLKSKNKDAISYVVSQAPKGIVSKGSSFSVSDEAANKHQVELMEKALTDFQSKAYLASTQFGFNCYEVVNININDRQVGTYNVNHSLKMMSMNSIESAGPLTPTPSYESANKKLSVTVNGSIQMHGRMNNKCWIN